MEVTKPGSWHSGPEAPSDSQVTQESKGNGSSSTRNVGVPALPDEFWRTLPVLQRIRTAARSRRVPADAVLGAMLARVPVVVPHTVTVPPFVGEPVPLTMFVAVVGPPGSGKSAALRLAQNLLPVSKEDRLDVVDPWPLGTGEGVLECLFDVVPRERAERRPAFEREQARHRAFLVADEGQALMALSGRKGATLMSVLREIWGGSGTGQGNAGRNYRRVVPPLGAAFGLYVGMQPKVAGQLLAEEALGTPQRFLWLGTRDPAFRHEGWPGGLPLWLPHVPREPYCVGFPSDVDEQIGRFREQVLTTGDGVESLAEHDTLMRLKVAAALALLSGALVVDDLVWELSGIVIETSAAVRAWVAAQVEAQRGRRTAARRKEKAETELYVRERKAVDARDRVAKGIGRHVWRHHGKARRLQGGAGRNDKGFVGCDKRCLMQSMAKDDRDRVAFEDVIEAAVLAGWIVEDGKHFRPGRRNPLEGR